MRFPTLAALTLAAFTGSAFAALPPPSDAAQAKAAETKDKAAWSAKVQSYLTCKAQDRAVADYVAHMQKIGKPANPSVDAGKPCVDPGPYASAAPAPPLESSGAHSPAADAKGPPSSVQPAAEQAPSANK